MIDFEARCAAALGGDPGALSALGDAPDAVPPRLQPTLALRAESLGLDPPEAWKQTLRAAAARQVIAEGVLTSVGESLGRAEVRWVPLKGADLTTRGIFQPAEERSFSDVDILVPESTWRVARRILEESGWEGFYDDPQNEDFLDREAYAWQTRREHSMLELHYRLWGSLPADAADQLLEAAEPDPHLPTQGARPTPAWAWVIAAAHTWLTQPRNPVLWWDLVAIGRAAPARLATEVVALTRQLGLHLPVALSAQLAADWWEDAAARSIAIELRRDLRLCERVVARRGNAQTPHGVITMARLLSRRSMRLGWKGAWRAVWPHAAVMGRGMPPNWSPARKRLVFLWRRFRPA